MWSTLVWNWSSTKIRPRLSVSSPALSRSRCSVWPCRPAEYITVSAGICLPLASVVTVPAAPTSTAVTSSPNRNVTARSRRWNCSASTTSGSQKSSIESRFSTTVTLVPSAANIDAYSMPITPAPTTTIDVGSDFRSRIPSESSTRSSSNSTPAGRAGLVPVAITMNSPSDRCSVRPGSVLDDNGVRVDESAVPGVEVDPVAHQLTAHHVLLLGDDVLGAGEQIRGRDLLLDAVAGAVQFALAHAGQVDHRFAQRLGRDGAGVDAHAAEHPAALDDGDRLAELCRRDGGLLPART